MANRRTGVAFGLAVWLFADEIGMPLLGLSGSTLHRPLEKRLQSITAHIVFGMTTETARRAVQNQLDAGHVTHARAATLPQ